MSRTAYLLDVSASLLCLYLSVWLYELGNWASLTTYGAKATLLWAGFFPAGVAAATSGGAAFTGAKELQVMICVGVTLVAFLMARKRGLSLTSVTLTGTMGIYVASMYWELLSITSFVPMVVHETIYIGLSAFAAVAFLRAFGGLPKNMGSESTQLRVASPSH